MNKKNIFFIVLTLLLTSCSEEPNSPDELFTISGIVKNSITKLPIEEAVVNFNSKQDTTDINGFYMINNLNSRDISYTIFHEGYDTLKGQIKLDKNQEVNFELNKKYTPIFKDIELLIYDIFDPHPFYISDAEVVINGNTYYSDNDGKVYIQNVEVDTQSVLITHPQYEEFYSQLIVADSIEVYNITLTPIFYDYFPLTSNSTYQYFDSFTHASTGEGDIYEGTKHYRNVRTDIVDNLKIHILEEESNLIHTSIHSDSPTLFDTTITQEHFYTYLSIVETESHVLFTTDAPNYISIVLSGGSITPGASINRYLPVSRGDSVYTIIHGYDYPSYYIMKPDMGLTYFHSIGYTHWISERTVKRIE